MSTSFDPYHRWLGIPPDEQPADHYRLLGLARFEDDPEVIHDAAERQMGHVRRYALGQQRELSLRFLNELGVPNAAYVMPALPWTRPIRYPEKRMILVTPRRPGRATGGVDGMSESAVLEQRLEVVEHAVADLQRRFGDAGRPGNWLENVTGSISDEPAFLEALEFGRAFRRADRPPDESGGQS